MYDPEFANEDKAWAQEHILSALLVGVVAGVSQSAKEIA